MRQKQLFTTVLACMALSACSNDEGLVPDNPNTFTGDEAYMSVRLADVGSAGTRGSSDGFDYGVDEHEVQNAFFYFYDKDETYVTQGEAWNGGDFESGTPAENIEFKGNTVVVLQGLSEKNYPKYMVTVLNRPAAFTPGETLEAMKEKLSDDNGVGIMTAQSSNGATTNYFTMSTTSYKHELQDGQTKATPYFVTEVKDINFSLTPIEEGKDAKNPVTVYVERLAAKVSLKVSDQLEGTTIDNGTLYPLKVTLNGGVNTEEAADAAEDEEAGIYVKFLGWKLNATAKHSKMMKNINESWDDAFDTDNNGFKWNDGDNYRSYWGKSFNYEDATCTYTGNGTNEALNYYNLEDNLLNIPGFDYCAENTNISTIVSDNFPEAVTGALLKAQVCDSKGKSLGTLVRYQGLLFIEANFLRYVLNHLKALNQLDYYTKTEKGGETTYKQIDEKFVKLDNVGNGEVKVVFEKPDGVGEIYSDNNGTDTPVTDENIASLNGNLATASKGANGFANGMMYYNIPIEHLNNTDINEGTNGKKIVPEAKYGVVRNHHYVITVTKLENLGKGIFEPNEVIIPDEVDQTKYYVGAKINILSWKLVDQDVEL